MAIIIGAVNGSNHSWPADLKANQVVRVRNNDAVVIGDGSSDIRNVIPNRSYARTIGGEQNLRGPSRSPQFISGGLLTDIHADGLERSRSEGHTPNARRVVSWARLYAERLAVQEQFHLLTVAIDFNIFVVRTRVSRRPVGEQHCWASFLCGRAITRIGWQKRSRRDAARNINHRPIAPPTLALKRERTRRSRAIE